MSETLRALVTGSSVGFAGFFVVIWLGSYQYRRKINKFARKGLDPRGLRTARSQYTVFWWLSLLLAAVALIIGSLAWPEIFDRKDGQSVSDFFKNIDLKYLAWGALAGLGILTLIWFFTSTGFKNRFKVPLPYFTNTLFWLFFIGVGLGVGVFYAYDQ